ncbi:unnamed protein product [Amoebophrya sp. A25]|nr:unnamed protein product [Amoebophrya sp. A25]|eukprot:GSA25T00017687001.1
MRESEEFSRTETTLRQQLEQELVAKELAEKELASEKHKGEQAAARAREDLERERKELMGDHADAVARLEEAQRVKNTNAASTERELHTKNAELEHLIARAKEAEAAAIAETAELRKQSEDMASDVRANLARSQREHAAEIDTLTSDLDQARRDLERQKSTYDQLLAAKNKEVQEQITHNGIVQSQKQQIQVEVRDLREALNAERDERAQEARNHLDRLSAERAAEMEQTTERTWHAQQLEQQLAQQREASERVKNELKDEARTLRDRLDTAQEETMAKEAYVVEVERKVQSLELQLEGREEQEARRVVAEAELSKNREERRELLIELRNAKLSLESLQRNCDAQKFKTKTAEDSKSELAQQVAALRKSLASADAEKNNLVQTVAQLRKADEALREVLRTERGRHDEDAQYLQRKLDDQKRQIEELLQQRSATTPSSQLQLHQVEQGTLDNQEMVRAELEATKAVVADQASTISKLKYDYTLLAKQLGDERKQNRQAMLVQGMDKTIAELRSQGESEATIEMFTNMQLRRLEEESRRPPSSSHLSPVMLEYNGGNSPSILGAPGHPGAGSTWNTRSTGGVAMSATISNHLRSGSANNNILSSSATPGSSVMRIQEPSSTTTATQLFAGRIPTSASRACVPPPSFGGSGLATTGGVPSSALPSQHVQHQVLSPRQNVVGGLSPGLPLGVSSTQLPSPMPAQPPVSTLQHSGHYLHHYTSSTAAPGTTVANLTSSSGEPFSSSSGGSNPKNSARGQQLQFLASTSGGETTGPGGPLQERSLASGPPLQHQHLVGGGGSGSGYPPVPVLPITSGAGPSTGVSYVGEAPRIPGTSASLSQTIAGFAPPTRGLEPSSQPPGTFSYGNSGETGRTRSHQ